MLMRTERLFKSKKIGLVTLECGVHQMARGEFIIDLYDFFGNQS